jgi:hypothetical protein
MTWTVLVNIKLFFTNFNIRTNTIFENLNNQEVIPIEELHSDERYKLKHLWQIIYLLKTNIKEPVYLKRKCELSSSRFKKIQYHQSQQHKYYYLH